MEPQPPRPAKKYHKQDSKRRIWLLTYAAGCPDITAELLHGYGIMCDETYSATWRESKYILFHLDSDHRIRISALNKVIKKMETRDGIKCSSITGYETVTCNTRAEAASIRMHPGFRRMVQLLNAGELVVWMAKGELATNKKGLLWRFIGRSEAVRNAYTQPLDALRAEIEQLRSAVAARDAELQTAAAEMVRLKTVADEQGAIADGAIARNKKLYRRLAAKGKKVVELEFKIMGMRRIGESSSESPEAV